MSEFAGRWACVWIQQIISDLDKSPNRNVHHIADDGTVSRNGIAAARTVFIGFFQVGSVHGRYFVFALPQNRSASYPPPADARL